MKRIIYILLALLAISSCEYKYEFDINWQMSDSLTYVMFVPSNESDTTFLYVQATTPLKDGRNPVRTEGESVQVLVNGSSIELEKQDLHENGFAGKVYSTTHKFDQGDEIELEVSIPDRKVAVASTTVPMEFPKPEWSYMIDVKGQFGAHKTGACFNIEYEKTPGSYGRYAVALIEEHTYQRATWYGNNVTGEYKWVESKPQVSFDNCTWYTPVDNMLSALGQDPLIFHPARLNRNGNRDFALGSINHNREAMAWTDIPDDTKGKGSHQVYVLFNTDKVDEAHPDPSKWDPDVPTFGYGYRYTDTYRYKLIFYSFDEACYNYQKARENVNTSALAGIGLAPSSMTYTNIMNGVGVCGAYTISESDWFKIIE